MEFTFFIHYLVVEMYRAEESLSLASDDESYLASEFLVFPLLFIQRPPPNKSHKKPNPNATGIKSKRKIELIQQRRYKNPR